MVEEMAALHSTGTWDLVTLHVGKSPVGCHWVYNVKIGSNGQVNRLLRGIHIYMASTTMTLFLLLPRWLPFVFPNLWLL